MTGNEWSDTRLRGAFAELAEAAGEGKDCLDPQRLWLSGRRELDPAENEAVLLHVAGCPSCALAWRIAKDLAPGPQRPARSRETRWTVRSRWTQLAAAAVLLVAVGGAVYLFSPFVGEREPAYRTQDSRWLHSMVDEAAPVPRNDLVLRWTPGPDGTLYDVLVTNDTAEPLARGVELDEPEYRVPAEALDAVTPGSEVFWQVNARLPDGRQEESETHIVRVE